MSRLLGAVALCAALASCTSGATTAPATTTTSSVTTTSPRVDTPRNLAGLDPCKLLTEAILKESGFDAITTAPALYPQIPGTCAFTVGDRTPEDAVVLVGVVDRAYEAAKAENPGGHQGLIEGHHVYFYCGGPEGEKACSASAAVGPDKTLTLALNQRGATDSRLLLVTQRLVTTILADRLPKAS